MKMPQTAMQLGQEVQRDPYAHLMTQNEKQGARCIPFRVAFNGLAAGSAALYYLSRTNELARVRAFRISFDMVFGVAWRVLFATVVADQISRRMFVNYRALKQHEMAEYEVKKVMRTWPHAKPHLAPHKRPNSYFWC